MTLIHTPILFSAIFLLCSMSEVRPRTVREQATQSVLSGGKGEAPQFTWSSSLALPIHCCLMLDSSHALTGPHL